MQRTKLRELLVSGGIENPSTDLIGALLDAFKILWPAQVLNLEHEGDGQRNYSISDFWSNGEHYRGTIPLIEKQIDEPNDDLVSIDYLTGKKEVIIEGITRGIG